MIFIYKHAVLKSEKMSYDLDEALNMYHNFDFRTFSFKEMEKNQLVIVNCDRKRAVVGKVESFFTFV